MRRLKSAISYMAIFFVISIIISYIIEFEFNVNFIVGQTVTGLLIGLFLAPHFNKAGASKAMRKESVMRVITNTMYIFLALFFIVFSMNFILDSANWTATALSGIPFLFFLLIRWIYRKKK